MERYLRLFALTSAVRSGFIFSILAVYAEMSAAACELLAGIPKGVNTNNVSKMLSSIKDKLSHKCQHDLINH